MTENVGADTQGNEQALVAQQEKIQSVLGGEVTLRADGIFDWKTPDGQLIEGQSVAELGSLVAKGRDYTKKTTKLAEERRANEARLKDLESKAALAGKLSSLDGLARVIERMPEGQRASFIAQLEQEVGDHIGRASEGGAGNAASTTDPRIEQLVKEFREMKETIAGKSEQEALADALNTEADRYEWSDKDFAGDPAEAKALALEQARKEMMYDINLDAADAVRDARDRLLKVVRKVEKAVPKKVAKTLTGASGSVGAGESKPLPFSGVDPKTGKKFTREQILNDIRTRAVRE